MVLQNNIDENLLSESIGSLKYQSSLETRLCVVMLVFFTGLWMPLGAVCAEVADSETVEESLSPESTVEASDSEFDFNDLDDFLKEAPDLTSLETKVSSYRIRPTDEVTGFAKTIEVNQSVKTVETVASVVSENAGVQVTCTGGAGSYATASIRGSTSSQVPVYIDGILLNSGGFSTVNLGDLNLSVFDSIEIYRGTTPIALGLGGIGGALSLKTREFVIGTTEFAASYGSWKTGHFFVLHGTKIGEMNVLAMASVQGSKGDYLYLNDNGTTFNSEDDEFKSRKNNRYLMYSTLLKAAGKVGKWQWAVLNDFLAKRQGLPGRGMSSTENAAIKNYRNTANARFSRAIGKKTNISLGTSYLLVREDYDDSEGEIGVGSQLMVARGDTVSTDGILGVDLSTKHHFDFRVEGTLDRFDQENALSDEVYEPSKAVRLGAGLEHVWTPWKQLKLISAGRLQWFHVKSPEGPAPGSVGFADAVSTTALDVSPSIGVSIEMLPGLTLKSNIGRYVRTPSISELFGDHGSTVGNPELKSETGKNVDLGVGYLLHDKGILSKFQVESALFKTLSEDLIVFVVNSQDTIQAENVNDANMYGIENSISIELARLVYLGGNYTFLKGRISSPRPEHDGKDIPGHPRHKAYGKLELKKTYEKWGFGAWTDINFTGPFYFTQYNTEKYRSLKKSLLGVGLRGELPRQGLTLTLKITNLLNKMTSKNGDGETQPLMDYRAYPLPGRSAYLTLHWKI